jgi:hypothetical protein
MKIKLSILVLFVSFIILSFFPSCAKDTVTTVTVKDTISLPSLSKIQILTSHVWEIQESTTAISGTVYNYERGVTNTYPVGLNQAPIRLTFNTNGTGTYTDPTTTVYNSSWGFNLNDSTIISGNITYNSTVTPYTYNLVNITDSVFSFSSSVPGGVAAYRCIPVP